LLISVYKHEFPKIKQV